MQQNRVLILATAGLTTDLLAETLNRPDIKLEVVIESKEAKRIMIKRRLKRLGYFKTLGQLLFLTTVLPFIPKKEERIAAILKKTGLKHIPIKNAISVDTVDSPQLIERIKIFKPDLIVINGTRILKKDLLNEINCPIVNIHVGITPKYRGVHGGYWAVKNNDLSLFGVTLHYVDSGIDTGSILAQSVISPSKEDNFKTFPILQYAEGLQLLSANITSIISGQIQTVPSLTKESKLHYHPGILPYLFGKKKVN